MADQKVRRDAAHNRQLLIRAARNCIAELGLDVPLSVIAKRAGLGAATLYRHFPSRDAMLAAVFEQEPEHCLEILGRAVDDPDPWRGLRTAVQEMVELELEHPGFTETVTARLSDIPEYEAFRARAAHGLSVLVRRLHAAGAVQSGFAVPDVFLILTAVRSVLRANPTQARARATRVLDYMAHGFAKTP